MENPLKTIREEYGLTKAEMAAVMNTSLQTYNLYERGDAFPSKKKLRLIADFFGLELDDLIQMVSEYKRLITLMRRERALEKVRAKKEVQDERREMEI